jgi:hypothetical protein
VTSPADDLTLLSIEELRVAVGLASDDDSKDDQLDSLGIRVAAMITASCMVVGDGLAQPTLRLEELTETYRLKSDQRTLYAARRPITEVHSITENGVTLTADVDYEFDAAAATFTRLTNDVATCWPSGKVVVDYEAGYETVPDVLKAIAAQLASSYWANAGIDPMEKRLSIPGLIDRERWVDQTANNQMPADILGALTAGGFVNRIMVF